MINSTDSKKAITFVEATPSGRTTHNRKPIRYIINEDTGCWECVSHILSDGAKYPSLYREGRRRDAHRYIYELRHGAINNSKLLVRHTCDNRHCINPKHLILGTHKDNTQDAVKRGRMTKGVRSHFAKLTEDDVRQIRAAKGISQAQLARDYHINQPTIWYIIHRKTWRHVA